MKITVITGSPRRRGSSAMLANKFIEGATEAGHEVYRFDAAFKKVHGCISCYKCFQSGACVFKDDMQELNHHLLEADTIVLVSPIFYFSITAQLKTIIDRFTANSQALTTPKKALLLLTMGESSTHAAASTTEWFRQLCELMTWQNMGVLTAHSPQSEGLMEPALLEATDYPMQAYQMGKTLS